MNQKDVQSIKKKAERYWFEDGIWEIGFGLVNILLAGFYLLVDFLQPPGIALMLIQMLVIVGAFLGMGHLVKWFKERVTYPRTGYVAYRRPATSARVKRALLAGLLAAVMGATVGAAASIHLLRNTTALVTGILLAVALVFIGYRFSLTRLYVLAGLTMLLGFAFSMLALPDTLDTAAFFGGFGLLVMLSGLLALANYLAHSQPSDDSGSEFEV